MVPLTLAMIAGPAAIAAAVSFPAQYEMLPAIVPLIVAALISYIIMLFSGASSKLFKKYDPFGAFIRMTGLIVATTGTQMALEGLSEYIELIG